MISSSSAHSQRARHAILIFSASVTYIPWRCANYIATALFSNSTRRDTWRSARRACTLNIALCQPSCENSLTRHIDRACTKQPNDSRKNGAASNRALHFSRSSTSGSTRSNSRGSSCSNLRHLQSSEHRRRSTCGTLPRI